VVRAADKKGKKKVKNTQKEGGRQRPAFVQTSKTIMASRGRERGKNAKKSREIDRPLACGCIRPSRSSPKEENEKKEKESTSGHQGERTRLK